MHEKERDGLLRKIVNVSLRSAAVSSHASGKLLPYQPGWMAGWLVWWSRVRRSRQASASHRPAASASHHRLPADALSL